MTSAEIAKMIDHAVLHPTATDAELERQCAIADQFHVATVCVKPCHTLKAVALMTNSTVGVSAVVGFPHGNSSLSVKALEASDVLTNGASEIDVVVNIGKVKQGDWGYINEEIGLLNALCVEAKAIMKVIFETGYLNSEEKIRLCELCNRNQVAFAKTSTGFGFIADSDGQYRSTGATDEDVQLMRKHCDPGIQIKASGGIKTLDQLLKFQEFGATRIGTSGTEGILSGARIRFG